MPRVSIYMDEATMRRMRAAARKEESSLSAWARKAILRALDKSWAKGYFQVFGSRADSDLKRPDQGRFEDDVPRQPL